MNEPEINGILRAMAWQRAKAELYAMLETYQKNMTKLNTLDNMIKKIIQKVEDHELHQ